MKKLLLILVLAGIATILGLKAGPLPDCFPGGDPCPNLSSR